MAVVPTQAELEQSLIDVSDLIKEMLAYGGSNTEKLVDHVDTIIDNSAWPGGSGLASQALGARAGLSQFAIGQAAGFIRRIMTGYLNIANSEFGSVSGQSWEDIWDYFDSNTRRVLERNPTYDTSVSKTGTGDPTWRRLTTDKDGYTIESAWFDDIVFECISDATTGRDPGEESLRGTTQRAIDIFSLDVSGEQNTVGLTTEITPLNSDNSFIGDHSFQSETAANASPTSLGDWEANVTVNGTNFEFIDTGFRQSTEEAAFSTPAAIALQIKTDAIISQDLEGVTLGVPYDFGFFARKAAGATGTITMTVGSNASATISISSLSDSSWTLVGATLDENLWPENFTQASPLIQIEVSSLSGTVDIDNVYFKQFDYYNGTFWNPVPGSTNLQIGYTGTFNDTLSSDSVIQKVIFLALNTTGISRNARGVGFYLPHTASGTPPEISDP